LKFKIKNDERIFERFSDKISTAEATHSVERTRRLNLHIYILLSITNKMQRYTIFFTTVNGLHVSGGFSAHHQELKTVHSTGYMSSLLAATASGSSKQADDGRRNPLKHEEH
jgi:hypothetical protein